MYWWPYGLGYTSEKDEKVNSSMKDQDLTPYTPEGQSFRQDIYDIIISYFLKFGNKKNGEK